MKFDNSCDQCFASMAGEPNHPTIAEHWEACPACYYPFTEEAALAHLAHIENERDILKTTVEMVADAAILPIN